MENPHLFPESKCFLGKWKIEVSIAERKVHCFASTTTAIPEKKTHVPVWPNSADFPVFPTVVAFQWFYIIHFLLGALYSSPNRIRVTCIDSSLRGQTGRGSDVHGTYIEIEKMLPLSIPRNLYLGTGKYFSTLDSFTICNRWSNNNVNKVNAFRDEEGTSSVLL